MISLVLLLAVFMLPIGVFANAAEPPSITIYSVDAPSDAEVFLLMEDGSEVKVKKGVRLWESYFWITRPDYTAPEKAGILRVRSSEGEFELPLPAEAEQQYNRYYTLHFEEMTLTENISPFRAPLLIGMRVLLTLLLEGLVYFLFRYREKRSYLVFLIVNLVTQIFVNVQLSGGSLNNYGSIVYTKRGYFALEAIVIIAEMAILPIFVKEKGKKVILHTYLANMVSMIVGGLLISVLPI